MRQIKYAVLHETMFYPEYGEIRKELGSTSNATNKAVKMSLDGSLVTLVLEHPRTKQLIEVLVPTTNFKLLVASAEAKPLPIPLKD